MTEELKKKIDALAGEVERGSITPGRLAGLMEDMMNECLGAIQSAIDYATGLYVKGINVLDYTNEGDVLPYEGNVQLRYGDSTAAIGFEFFKGLNVNVSHLYVKKEYDDDAEILHYVNTSRRNPVAGGWSDSGYVFSGTVELGELDEPVVNQLYRGFTPATQEEIREGLEKITNATVAIQSLARRVEVLESK